MSTILIFGDNFFNYEENLELTNGSLYLDVNLNLIM